MTANHITPIAAHIQPHKTALDMLAQYSATAGRTSWNVDDLAKTAKEISGLLMFASDTGTSDLAVLARAREYLPSLSANGRRPSQQVARLKTSKFWRRALRREVWQSKEMEFLRAGAVGGKSGRKYVSDFSAKIKQEMDEAQAEWLAASHVEATIDGELIKLGLADLHAKSQLSRMAEFWSFCQGFQKLAEDAGLELSMWTLTAEPEFHPNPTVGRNKWNGASPAATHREMGRRYAQLRASLNQRGIKLSGFRAAEPHGDGCPHWHLLVAYEPGQRTTIMAEILKLWPGKLKLRRRMVRNGQEVDVESYSDDPAMALAGVERVAAHHNESAQTEWSVINTALRGANTLIGYVTKYIIKQGLNPTDAKREKLQRDMQGLAVELEFETDTVRRAELVHQIEQAAQKRDALDAEDAAAAPARLRAAAWRACWGSRGIQWFGIRNALTPWRELRRIPEKRFIHKGIERALWNRARNGDAAGFIEMLGGLAAAPIAKQASCKALNQAKTNAYGETVKKIVGVTIKDEATGTTEDIISRPHEWQLVTEWPQQAGQAAAVPAVAVAVAAPAAPVHAPVVAGAGIGTAQVLDLFWFPIQSNNNITVISNTPSKPATGFQPVAASSDSTKPAGILPKKGQNWSPGGQRSSQLMSVGAP